jgi:threonine dehydrogenase-like Zn-dependent dehydrogenase
MWLWLKNKRKGLETMKAAVTDGKGNVWIDEVPMPELNEYQCLCKINACATCTGTDQKHINNKLPWDQEYPGLLGHESCGVVVEIGSKVRNIKVGDRYLRPAAVYPGETLGDFSSMWGGFAEYGKVTDVKAATEDCPDIELNPYTQFQQKLPADLNISDTDATSIITLKECASYVATSGIGVYKSLLLLGAGSVGISMLRFAKIFGAHPVIVVARRDEQLEYATKIGADFTINTQKEDVVARVSELTEGKGVDFILDTTGSIECLTQSLPALSPDGKVAPYATYEKGKDVPEMLGEDKLAPGATGEHLIHDYMLSAVRLSLLDLSDFYSHTLPFSQIKEGFEMLKSKEAFKIVFEI